MSSVILKASKLCKNYGETKALIDLDLELSRGEMLGLLGPNGAGKTTAIHIFLGLLSASSGEINIFGMSPIKNRHLISKRLNFSSAYVQLPSNLKVIENLKLFSRLYQIKHWKKKIEELLTLFDIADLSNRLTGALSAGEKTRLNLCKCLLNDPELLLLDEPTASLDPEMADTVRKTLKKIQLEKNMSILYTSHNMHEVEQICNRIIFIHEGRKIAEGGPKSVIKEYGSQTLEEVFIKIVRKNND